MTVFNVDAILGAFSAVICYDVYTTHHYRLYMLSYFTFLVPGKSTGNVWCETDRQTDRQTDRDRDREI